jgi:hypothetical protein
VRFERYLKSGSGRASATEAVACQPEKRVEHASRVRTQGHSGPKGHLPSSNSGGFFECALP